MPDEMKSLVSNENIKTSIIKFVTVPIQAIRAAEKHIELVSAERAYYKDACKASTTALKACFTGPDGNFTPPSTGSCIPTLQNEMTVHYSFDFAQQVR